MIRDDQTYRKSLRCKHPSSKLNHLTYNPPFFFFELQIPAKSNNPRQLTLFEMSVNTDQPEIVVHHRYSLHPIAILLSDSKMQSQPIVHTHLTHISFYSQSCNSTSFLFNRNPGLRLLSSKTERKSTPFRAVFQPFRAVFLRYPLKSVIMYVFAIAC